MGSLKRSGKERPIVQVFLQFLKIESDLLLYFIINSTNRCLIIEFLVPDP